MRVGREWCYWKIIVGVWMGGGGRDGMDGLRGTKSTGRRGEKKITKRKRTTRIGLSTSYVAKNALLCFFCRTGNGEKENKQEGRVHKIRMRKNDVGKKYKRVSRRVRKERVQIKNVSVKVCHWSKHAIFESWAWRCSWRADDEIVVKRNQEIGESVGKQNRKYGQSSAWKEQQRKRMIKEYCPQKAMNEMFNDAWKTM